MATFKKNFQISGSGIHSGCPVTMVIKPSKKTGIIFRRTDIDKNLDIPAYFNNVCETKMRNTTIGNMDNAYVQTIEHLMAAFMIVGVDSAIVEIDGPETPIMDGSAYEFLKKFLEIGVVGAKLKRVVVKKEIVAYSKEVKKNISFFEKVKFYILNKLAGRKTDGFVKLTPNDGHGLNVMATLVYPEKIIGSQSFSYEFDGTKKSCDVFMSDVARARTFGKISEWDWLKKHGMARGASEHNVIVVNASGDGTLNDLYWPDEFVRHKVIDALGDMFMSNGIVVGNLISYKGSHALNNLVLRKLFNDPENYEILEM